MIRRPPRSTRTDTLFPYTTRFRSLAQNAFLRRRLIGDDQRRDQFFTPSSAGHPEHRAFAHTSEAGQEGLHPRRIHIHAATDDHVLGTADKLEIAVRCPTGEVASHKPTGPSRSEERRLGRECVRPCRSGWSTHRKTKNRNRTQKH